MLEKIRKAAVFIPAIIWMYVIYALSDKTAVKSSIQSETLALRLVRLVTRFSSMTDGDKVQLSLILEPYIRDIAHMAEYAILFILLYIAVRAFISCRYRTLLLSLAVCFLYACTDEIHQYFVPGRAFELMDIGLDILGAGISAVLLLLLITKHQKSGITLK